jgi:hypothetical protein
VFANLGLLGTIRGLAALSRAATYFSIIRCASSTREGWGFGNSLSGPGLSGLPMPEAFDWNQPKSIEPNQ